MLHEIFENAFDFVQNSKAAHVLIGTLLLLLAVYASHVIFDRLIYKVMRMLGSRMPEFVREVIVDEALFRRLALFVPAQVLYQGIGLLPHLSESLVALLRRLLLVWLVVIGVQVLRYVFSRIDAVYSLYPVAKSRPIKGYIQVLIIAIYVFGFIVALSVLMGQSPIVFISGLGALTAVILLVFRDTLLSFVAGIQITTNNLIRVGDWIEMPQFGADGDVVDIALHVVRVQNWDRTITFIPTHKFLDNSFKNWRGMQDSGGRRIKRSIFIDMSSVGFLGDEDIAYFSRYALLKDYMAEKLKAVSAHNSQYEIDDKTIVNGRRLTNIGTFRAYVVNYLKQHPQIHQDMTFLVRQLQPTPEGLPLEIYVFVNDVRWVVYEGVQSDIFDHILSMVPKFKLRVYQRPSSYDLSAKLFDDIG